MKQLQLTSTQTGKKSLFKSVQPGVVIMYGCGITPYDYSHIGHARSAITCDTLVRVLKALDYKVMYIRNVTDVDDKILIKAAGTENPYDFQEITKPYIEDFDNQMELIGCLKPMVEPLVTEHIPEIINLIGILMDRGYAYRIEHDIYYDISKFSNYCKLSHRNLDDLIAGARVEHKKDDKRNPGDFVLWKGNDEDLFWQSPWGYGRPGWHIECSAMIDTYCKDRPLDIHAGGADLIFPHHENEIAQSEPAFDHDLANTWVHTAMLSIDKEKMSKSLGNIIILHTITKEVEPLALRLYFLQHVYHTPMHYSSASLEAAEKAFYKLHAVLSDVVMPKIKVPLSKMFYGTFLDHAFDAMIDDLNTSKALGLIFENLGEIKKSKELQQLTKLFLHELLGLAMKPQEITEDQEEMTPEVAALLLEREEARAEKNWARADMLRDKLKDLGYEVVDRKS